MHFSIRLAILIAVAIFGNQTVQAQESCADLFKVETLPSISQLREQLPAIHLTDYLPHRGIIIAHSKGRARFLTTVHFTLGQPVIDHSNGQWAKKKYAIVTPVKSIENQIVNLFPQDTFVLGDVTLTKDARVFVPRGEKIDDIGLAQVIYYDQNFPIKQVVEDYLRQTHFIQLAATGSRPENPVYYNGKDVADISNWAGLATNNVTNVVHKRTIWGEIDYQIHEDFQLFFLKGSHLVAPSVQELKSSLETYNDLLQTADQAYRELKNLPPSAHDGYRRNRLLLKNVFIALLEIELSLQTEHGKTLLGWSAGHGKTLEAINSDVSLKAFVESHLSELPNLISK